MGVSRGILSEEGRVTVKVFPDAPVPLRMQSADTLPAHNNARNVYFLIAELCIFMMCDQCLLGWILLVSQCDVGSHRGGFKIS